MTILNSINQMQKEMKEWRQDLHQIPEIGLQEYKTSEYIQSKLSSWNIEFKTGYANTGIVAWIRGNQGSSERSIGLRADFDALPMTEKNLFNQINKVRKYFSSVIKNENYEKTLEILSSAKKTTDNFFDNVIVNDENSDIKKNRLELLQMFCKTYNNFIDFSKVEGA